MYVLKLLVRLAILAPLFCAAQEISQNPVSTRIEIPNSMTIPPGCSEYLYHQP
jgi:hypothetical protein